jgi:hypothetical protein
MIGWKEKKCKLRIIQTKVDASGLIGVVVVVVVLVETAKPLGLAKKFTLANIIKKG